MFFRAPTMTDSVSFSSSFTIFSRSADDGVRIGRPDTTRAVPCDPEVETDAPLDADKKGVKSDGEVGDVSEVDEVEDVEEADVVDTAVEVGAMPSGMAASVFTDGGSAKGRNWANEDGRGRREVSGEDVVDEEALEVKSGEDEFNTVEDDSDVVGADAEEVEAEEEWAKKGLETIETDGGVMGDGGME